MKKQFKILTISLLIIAVCCVSPVISDTVLRLPILLEAHNILDKDIVQGKNYTVHTAVLNDGLINTYHLTTDYGRYDLESTANLINRINELNALAAMEQMEKSGIFKDSLVKGVKAPIQGAVDLVTSPIETTKGIFKGTGKFLSNIGRSIVSSDPHQDNVFKVAVGYDAAKRAYAYEFGIDPYTSYGPVVDRLGEIARAAVAGGFIPKATIAVLDHDVVTVMRLTAATKNLRKLVRDKSPGDLHKINKEKLEKLRIQSSQIKSFLSNYSYTPQEKTVLIGMVEQMKGVLGLDVFIAAANTSTESADALLYGLIARMMAGYHTKIASVKQILMIDGTIHLKTNKNILILTAPVDFVFKTDLVIRKLNTLDKKIQSMSNVNGKELWITGNIDRSAHKMFEASGWFVVENANSIFNKE